MDEPCDDPGVYVVLDEPVAAFVISVYTFLDRGKTSAVRTRVYSNDREHCWRRNAPGRIAFVVLYLPGAGPDRRRNYEAADAIRNATSLSPKYKFNLCAQLNRAEQDRPKSIRSNARCGTVSVSVRQEFEDLYGFVSGLLAGALRVSAR